MIVTGEQLSSLQMTVAHSIPPLLLYTHPEIIVHSCPDSACTAPATIERAGGWSGMPTPPPSPSPRHPQTWMHMTIILHQPCTESSLYRYRSTAVNIGNIISVTPQIAPCTALCETYRHGGTAHMSLQLQNEPHLWRGKGSKTSEILPHIQSHADRRRSTAAFTLPPVACSARMFSCSSKNPISCSCCS